MLRGRGRQLQKWRESPGASRGQCDRAAAVPHLENGPHLEDAEMTQLTEGALQRGLAASGAPLYQRLTFDVCGQIPSHFSFPNQTAILSHPWGVQPNPWHARWHRDLVLLTGPSAPGSVSCSCRSPPNEIPLWPHGDGQGGGTWAAAVSRCRPGPSEQAWR